MNWLTKNLLEPGSMFKLTNLYLLVKCLKDSPLLILLSRFSLDIKEFLSVDTSMV